MRKKKKFANGLRASVKNRKRASASFAIGISIFIAMNLAARPIFSKQMLSSSLANLPETVSLIYLYNSTNILQMTSTAVYAALAGPAIVLMALQLKHQGSGIGNIVGIAPGMLASGCAGCGAGLIGLLGLTGALALLPFNGLLITPAAIIMIVFFITKSGNPKTCNL